MSTHYYNNAFFILYIHYVCDNNYYSHALVLFIPFAITILRNCYNFSSTLHIDLCGILISCLRVYTMSCQTVLMCHFNSENNFKV